MKSLTPQLVAVMMLLSPLAALGQVAQPPPRQISVSGEATVFVVPDEVTVRVGVEMRGDTVAAAKEAVEERSRRLLNAAQRAGVPAEDIQTEILSVQVLYRQNSDTREVSGYFARRMYVIKIKDLSLLEKVVDATLSNGANVLEGIEFQSRDLRKHRDAARKLAAQAARQKADLLAGELGAKVGQAQQISESGGVWFPMARGQNFQNAMQDMGGGGGQDSETLPVGKIAVRAAVSVTFSLE